jgi:adenosine/AMP kinase|tara:strand:+ start:198 stop:1121 length:924 start_codon:yes stop_codon:yes gene_type:complete
MRPGICAENMQKRVLLVLFSLFLQPFALAETAESDVTREAQGGHAILLEQYTATWCDSCATIDPWISDFVDSHSSRVVRVALHPDDHDPFGSPLTTQRIGLKQAEHQLQLPSFWFDGQGELQGAVSQSLLANELRSAEIERSDWIGMQVVWDTWVYDNANDSHTISIYLDEALPVNSTLTVFRIQSLEMTSEIAYNGIDVHHDVATQMITFDENGHLIQSFEGTHGWDIIELNQTEINSVPAIALQTQGKVDGFVTIIEENGAVRSVVGIYDGEIPRNTEIDQKMGVFWLLLALVISSALVSRGKPQ